MLILAKSDIASTRPCPRCGGVMHYKATWLTALTGLRRRVCIEPTCAYTDDRLVKVLRESDS